MTEGGTSTTLRPWLAALALALVGVTLSLSFEPSVHAVDRRRERHRVAYEPRLKLRPFHGLGTWIDIYDNKQWKDPEAAVRRMVHKRVDTLYLETANYRIDRAVFRPGRVSRFIERAHTRGIDVVAWYLPDLNDLDRDLRRSRAALDFVSEHGQGFDGFALDVEATVVRNIERRNRRMLRLSERIAAVSGSTPRAAIVPDPIGSLYWPNFPYAEVASRYSALFPMGYFTYRTSGAKGVRAHVGAGVEALRRQIDSDKRIHYIGGLSSAATVAEVRAYRRVVIRRNLMGGGLYDFPGTSARMWDVLKPIARLGH